MFGGLRIALGLGLLLTHGLAQAQPTGPADALLAEGDFAAPSVLRHRSSSIEPHQSMLVYSSVFASPGELVASYVAWPYENPDLEVTDHLLDLLGSLAGGTNLADDVDLRLGDQSRWLSSFSMESGPGHTVAFRVGRWMGAVEVRGGPSGPDRVRQATRLGAILVRRLEALPPAPVGVSAAAFAGEWGRHGVSLRIQPDGTGSVTWRTYRWCSESPAPCDVIADDGTITSGGWATLQLSEVQAGTLRGRVTATVSVDEFGLGEARVTLAPYQMAVVQFERYPPMLLCGDRSIDSLPTRFRESAPCGA